MSFTILILFDNSTSEILIIHQIKLTIMKNLSTLLYFFYYHCFNRLAIVYTAQACSDQIHNISLLCQNFEYLQKALQKGSSSKPIRYVGRNSYSISTSNLHLGGEDKKINQLMLFQYLFSCRFSFPFFIVLGSKKKGKMRAMRER